MRITYLGTRREPSEGIKSYFNKRDESIMGCIIYDRKDECISDLDFPNWIIKNEHFMFSVTISDKELSPKPVLLCRAIDFINESKSSMGYSLRVIYDDNSNSSFGIREVNKVYDSLINIRSELDAKAQKPETAISYLTEAITWVEEVIKELNKVGD